MNKKILQMTVAFVVVCAIGITTLNFITLRKFDDIIPLNYKHPIRVISNSEFVIYKGKTSNHLLIAHNYLIMEPYKWLYVNLYEESKDFTLSLITNSDLKNPCENFQVVFPDQTMWDISSNSFINFNVIPEYLVLSGDTFVQSTFHNHLEELVFKKRITPTIGPTDYWFQ